MSTEQAKARAVLGHFLERQNKTVAGMTDDTSLWRDGLDLDSLEAAELSATLEDELGTDPFSVGADMPETVGDIVVFYPATPAT